MYKKELFELIESFRPSQEALAELGFIFQEQDLIIDDDFLFYSHKMTFNQEAKDILMEIISDYFQDSGYRWGEPSEYEPTCID